MFALAAAQPVERNVFRDAHAPGLHILDRVPLLTAVPHFYKNFLHYVLSLLAASQQAEGKPVQLIFADQHAAFKGLEVHRIHEPDGAGRQMLQERYSFLKRQHDLEKGFPIPENSENNGVLWQKSMESGVPDKKVVAYGAFQSVIEANLAKTKLDAYGVPCFLTDEHLASLYPLNYFSAGQVRLHVFEEDLQRVKEILEEGET